MERTITVPVTLPESALTAKSLEPEPTPKRLTYSRREAAAALGVSLPTLDAFMNRADHPLPRIRQGYKLTLIPVAALEQWVMDEAARNSGTAARR